MRFCLDSWAVIRWLDDSEPASSRVDELLEGKPLMSWINLGEIYYVLHRKEGPGAAAGTISDLRSVLTLDLPSERRVIEAASIKAVHTMSYADAFAVATALAHGATLLTGDPEILNAGEGWPVEDVR